MLEIKPILSALSRSKAGALLLLLQIAITTAIVSNATFIISDHLAYLQQDTGYPQDEVFSFGVMTFGDIDVSQQFELDETMLRNVPGVINASLVSQVPLSGSGSSSGFSYVPPNEEGESVSASYMLADEHIINTLGVKLIEGRNFTTDDVIVTDNVAEVPNVVIASKSFTDELFPEQNAIGKTIYLGNEPLQIIGIVEKMMSPWPRSTVSHNMIIIPLVMASTNQQIMVRTAANERAAIMKQIEDTMLDAYDQRVINNVDGLDESKRSYDSEDILMMRMLMVLIGVLILVTALGIFGLTLFNISKRTKQIGTRRALGARKSAIIKYFILENSLVCSLGLVVGCIAAVFLGRQLMQEYSLPALESTFIVGTAIFIFAMSILAAIFPAKRAANISPSIATRSI
jgi:putative ABC transport system permease protein